MWTRARDWNAFAMVLQKKNNVFDTDLFGLNNSIYKGISKEIKHVNLSA